MRFFLLRFCLLTLNFFLFASSLLSQLAALAPYGSFLAMAPPSSLNEGGGGAAGTTAAAREHVQQHAGAVATAAAAAAAATTSTAVAADDTFGQPAAIPAGDGKRVSAADIQVRPLLCSSGEGKGSRERERARSKR